MNPGKPESMGHGESSPEPKVVREINAESAVRVTTESQAQERKRSYVALMVLTAGALYVAYIVYRPFLKSLFLALVLTIAFWPIYRWIAKRVPGDNWRALATTAVVILVIMLPLMMISFRLVSEAV